MTLSQPSIVCINIVYKNDSLLDLGDITLVVLSVRDVNTQIILKPKGRLDGFEIALIEIIRLSM